MYNYFDFYSDNAAPAHEKILQRLLTVNHGWCNSYSQDEEYTKKVEHLLCEQFGTPVTTAFVSSGTMANVLSLWMPTNETEAVICANTAHIYTSESGAVPKHTGCSLLPISQTNGKITIETIRQEVSLDISIHHSKPAVISITQPTEKGALYTLAEIKQLADFAHQHDMMLHLDGARIANACAAMGVSLKSMVVDTGVDILSLGGTKNGLLMAEAVVVLNPAIDCSLLPRYQKQLGQLHSKNRFIAAQFLGYFEEDLWLSNAKHANDMALYFASKMEDFGLTLVGKVEVNMLFCKAPKEMFFNEQAPKKIHAWNATTRELRFVFSYCTQKQDVDNFFAMLSSNQITFC